jgi:hypothetical protein
VGSVIRWWEVRRLPINLIIGGYGIVCLIVFFAAISVAHVLKPGEDAVEPLALMAALVVVPVVFNICYTLGWLVEVAARALTPGLSPKLGPRLLMAGLAFSLCIISLPAVFWVGYVCLRVVGVVK